MTFDDGFWFFFGFTAAAVVLAVSLFALVMFLGIIACVTETAVDWWRHRDFYREFNRSQKGRVPD